MKAVGRIVFFDGERALILVRRHRRRGIKREMVGWNPWIPIPGVYVPEELKEIVESSHRNGKVLMVEFVLLAEEVGAGEEGNYEFRVTFTREGVEYWMNGYLSDDAGVVDVLGIPFRVEGLSEGGYTRREKTGTENGPHG